VSAPEFTLTILGSGGALPVPGKYPSSQYLQYRNQGYLIDAGEGVQVQLARFGISHSRIDHIFITHLHGDHYLGLMGLLFSMHLTRRLSALHIHCHPGLEDIILLQLKMARSVLSYRIHFNPLQEGVSGIIFENDDLTVSTFPLRHRVPCSGFLFREKLLPWKIIKDKMPDQMRLQDIALLKQGKDVVDDLGNIVYRADAHATPPPPPRSYAYCSDTDFDPAVAASVKGVTLLYHEATFAESESVRARETFHSTAREAATIARMAGAGKLLIGHISARYKGTEVLLEEARAVFPETEVALDGHSHKVEPQPLRQTAE